MCWVVWKSVCPSFEHNRLTWAQYLSPGYITHLRVLLPILVHTHYKHFSSLLLATSNPSNGRSGEVRSRATYCWSGLKYDRFNLLGWRLGDMHGVSRETTPFSNMYYMDPSEVGSNLANASRAFTHVPAGARRGQRASMEGEDGYSGVAEEGMSRKGGGRGRQGRREKARPRPQNSPSKLYAQVQSTFRLLTIASIILMCAGAACSGVEQPPLRELYDVIRRRATGASDA